MSRPRNVRELREKWQGIGFSRDRNMVRRRGATLLGLPFEAVFQLFLLDQVGKGSKLQPFISEPWGGVWFGLRTGGVTY